MPGNEMNLFSCSCIAMVPPSAPVTNSAADVTAPERVSTTVAEVSVSWCPLSTTTYGPTTHTAFSQFDTHDVAGDVHQTGRR